MKTITLTKPNGEKFQVNDRRSESKQFNNFQVNFGGGYVDHPSTEEMMLPVGFQVLEDGSIETPNDRIKRITTNTDKPKSAMADDDEMLLPAGIHLEG